MHPRTWVTIMLGSVVALTIVVSLQNSSPALAQLDQQTFTTQMSGAEEAPSVDTVASGTAEFNLSSDGSSIGYQVNVTGISGITAAHIHSGNVGENGPVIVTLFKSDTPTDQINGVLADGTFSASDLEGPMEGMELSDLVSAMSNGVTYVNVHTQTNPEGEIRGQI
jgi:hypothetical protein